VALARENGITRFTADTQAGNAQMMSVFRGSGFALTSDLDHGVLHVEFGISDGHVSRPDPLPERGDGHVAEHDCCESSLLGSTAHHVAPDLGSAEISVRRRSSSETR
jgi:hypothetical protein